MNRLLLALAIFLVFSCASPQQETVVHGRITHPVSASFWEDETIYFRVETPASNITWVSSLDGAFETGRTVLKRMSQGSHKIEVKADGKTLDTIMVVVEPVEYTAGSYRQISVQNKNNTLLLPAGGYTPVIISQTQHTQVLGFSHSDPVFSYMKTGNASSSFLDLKTYTYKPDHLSFDKVPPGSRSLTFDIPAAPPAPGTIRKFILADTTYAVPAGFERDFKLIRISDRIHLWLDCESDPDHPLLHDFWNTLNEQALPRVIALWGPEWADTDANGAVTVLVSPLINQQGRAIGYFNPGDLYPYNNNPASPVYNILSNEMDAIYLADPTWSPDIFAYSPASIIATFCHEMTHLITYSHKVYFRQVAGFANVKREELFLDEGLAHLSESLCGYGVSGGNLAFFSLYLSNPGRYSLQYKDRDGAIDSIGKRGAVSGFLSWLFWKKGGAIWDSDDPGLITDTGGIAFLRRFLMTDQIGWDNITWSYGASADTLFERWILEIDRLDRGIASADPVYIDPITGEAITMCPFFGDIILNGTVYPLNGPARVHFNTVTVVPGSAVWGHPFDITEKTLMNISAEQGRGLVAARFNMY